jgi:hypothetical protein
MFEDRREAGAPLEKKFHLLGHPTARLLRNLWLMIVVAVGAFVLASCVTDSTHNFATPAEAWQTRTGQLAYEGPRMSLIGEVLVRFSKSGEMELTFSKGPGVNLLVLRQDAQFGSAEGPLAHGRWSGPVSTAPGRLRGWFSLREKIVAGRTSIDATNAGESFNLRF